MLIWNLFIALDVPFFLLPFRPTSDPSAARTFIRNYFDGKQALHGENLLQELRLTEPMVRFTFCPGHDFWGIGTDKYAGAVQRGEMVLE